MKKWSIILMMVLLPLVTLIAQTYQYIGVEDGLSNRRVSSILKGPKGYMWFLTQEGVDRYNGKEIKHYKILESEGDATSSLWDLGWLLIDKKGTIWEIGRNGNIFCYFRQRDLFASVYKFPASHAKDIEFSFIDNNQRIWLCSRYNIYLYDIATSEITIVQNTLRAAFTDVKQVDDTHFYASTENGVYAITLKESKLEVIPIPALENIKQQVNELYYLPRLNKLFIGTFQRGIYVYDTVSQSIYQPQTGLVDISISRIKPLNDSELLIATDGAGVYKINIFSYVTKPYIIADYTQNNAMNGNTIADIYVDEEQRIWLANTPIGITVCKNRFYSYQWIKHSTGNSQSLVNNHVNVIIEDSEGDLWYGTNNGISLYEQRTGKWHSFLSSFNQDAADKNHIFTTLCEISPGIIWAGGYNSGIYQIQKKGLLTSYFDPSLFYNLNIRPDKYIRSIVKDSEGNIWSGGYYNLKRMNLVGKSMKLYNGLSSVTSITERNSKQMWIGSATGLYLIDKHTGAFEQIRLPVESNYIHCLYQAPDDKLYIGTSGSGMLIYNAKDKTFMRYDTENCALISNNIYAILPNPNGTIAISTENSLVTFSPSLELFQNWTEEQGLMTTHFNPASGVLTREGMFVMGSANGAVEFSKDIKMPKSYSSRMVLSDFSVFYQTTYPGEPDSPLLASIDDTQELHLRYDQNTFALKVSSINYDYPSNVLYSWKLEGFYDEWSYPSNEDLIRFTNISPGNYTLHIRAVSNEDKRIVLEERAMHIVVAKPFWLTIWAFLFYLAFIAFIVYNVFRIVLLRKQRKASSEKIDFFINTAHDIRTPLTLIKAPLEELQESEELSHNGIANMNTAMRNVNALLHLTTNLINFERADVYSTDLYINEYELNSYVQEMMNPFQQYAETKHIRFDYHKEFPFLNVWFDKEKMDSILKNLISNALKYTPENGEVQVTGGATSDEWYIEVKDTGIGIPSSEQKKLFKIHFRGSNAINSKVTGSGIGLMLVRKLVTLHSGEISLDSVENEGSTVRVTFPRNRMAFHRAQFANRHRTISGPTEVLTAPATEAYESVLKQSHGKQQRIMVVEDNDELRRYLEHTLSEDYNVQGFPNGKEALEVVKEFKPELIISDIMMPEMRGDELCAAIKNDIETSHIPVILLTALNDDKNIMDSLKIGADEYIVKPFNLGIMKASISSMLTNRALLRSKYANLEISEANNNDDCLNCNTDIDWKFIASVKQQVENNMDNPAFNVDVLCNLLNMSRTSFYNKLKALTDQAPGDYIRLIRLKRAAQLLKEGTHNVTEIAELTGFSDAKYFREVFKRHYKVSPSKYGKGEEKLTEQ